MNISDGFDFDDVLLVPSKASTISHRDDVDTSVDLGTFKLGIPIIASPMKGIISYELVKKLSSLGGIGIFHRFDTPDDILRNVKKASKENLIFGVSVAHNTENWATLLEYQPNILCVDVANGYEITHLAFITMLADYIYINNLNTLLMSGNVIEEVGTTDLINAGAKMIRVGIGGGSLCTTRNVTGVGCPQLTAIERCATARDSTDANVSIVSDGGIRNSGDIVKALAFGADCVMIGGLFGKTYESAHNGIIYGMASRKLQEEYYHVVKSVEGMEKVLAKNITTEELIDELTWGIKSACTYLNCQHILELGLLEDINFVFAGNGSIKIAP